MAKHTFIPQGVCARQIDFEIEDGKLRLPFVALSGVGENAAKALYEAAGKGEISAAEDLLAYPGISQSLIDTLDSLGALGDIPKTRQISLWDF